MGKIQPLRACTLCKTEKVIFETVSFIHGGLIYQTKVAVCTNADCVRKRGGTVTDQVLDEVESKVVRQEMNDCMLRCVCGDIYDTCRQVERRAHFWCWNNSTPVNPEPA